MAVKNTNSKEFIELYNEKLADLTDAISGKKFISTNEDLDQPRMSVTEALSTADAAILFPKVISTLMMEAAEPEYLASQFLQRIEFKEGRSMEFINFGAIRAFDIAEGSPYPEQNLDLAKFGAASTEVRVSKVGLKVAITEEMISDSQWDVINMHIKAAGRAMARKKEEKIFEEFSKHGHTVFDGDAPANSVLSPSGRGFDGTKNSTLSAEDFIAMCTAIMASGFTPTDVVMHPLCWALFAKNQFLSDLMGVGAFGGVTNPGSADKDGYAPKQTYLGKGINFNLPISGLSLHFSPWVPFNQVDKKFDMYILDRANVGVMLVKDDMSTEQFSDPERDIMSLKVRERYGIGVLNGGRGIVVAKNIAFKKTFPIPERDFVPMDMPADMTNATMDSI